MADREPWRQRHRRRRRIPLVLSSFFLALSVLLALSRGCLSEQYGAETEQQQQQNHQQQNQQQHKHHHIFNSRNHTRRNRHPRVPPRRDACDPHSVPPRKRCEYVTEQRSCEAAGGRVPYTRLWFCLVFGDEGGDEIEGVGGEGAGALPTPAATAAGGNSSSPSSSSPQDHPNSSKAPRTFSLPAAALLLLGALLWAACLFSLLAVVSSSFLAPAVSWVAAALRVPPALAGVTLLALAGGAPDLATEIAAVLSRDYGGFGGGDFEMVFEDGTPAPPLSPAERAAAMREADAIVADDMGMGVAVALGSSLATLCCGLAAIGWFARSRNNDSSSSGDSSSSRKARRRSKRWPPPRRDVDDDDASDDDSSNPNLNPIPTVSPGIAVEDARAFARDVTAYLVALLSLGVALFDGALGLWEAVGLLSAYLLYVAASVLGSRASEREREGREGREEEREEEEEEEAARRKEEEERHEAAEEGSGGGGFAAKKGRVPAAVPGSPPPPLPSSSIEMTAKASPLPSSSSSAVLLPQQLPPRSPVRSPFNNTRGAQQQQQQQGGCPPASSNNEVGGGAFAAASAAAFPSAAMRAVAAAPRRRASTEVGDAYAPDSSCSSFSNSNPRAVVAPPPTPAGGFGAALRNFFGGAAAGGGGGNNNDLEASSSRAPLLLPASPSPPEATAAALTSAFSEPLTDRAGAPFPAAQSQQQRNRSRSPVGRLSMSSQLTRLPRRLSSSGAEGAEAAASAAAAATTTGFSLSPNNAAAAFPLALETTAAGGGALQTEKARGGDDDDDEAAAAAARPRARKGARPSSRRQLLAAAALSKADALLPSPLSSRLPPWARLLLAALVAPVAAALHCTMPAFGEEEGEGLGGRNNNNSVAEEEAEAKETAAAVVSLPPPPEIPLLTLTRAAVLCVCAPLAAASLLGATPTAAGGWLKFSLSALGGACALAVAFAPYFWSSRGKAVPLRCAASAALALALSGVWLAAAADEAVDLARALSRAARLPSELAGGVLLGAGEALPDVAATAALARAAAKAAAVAASAAAAATAAAAASSSSSSAAAARARARAADAAAKAAEAPARIALGATFGAPVFNLLVGLPLPAAVAALRSGWSSSESSGSSGTSDGAALPRSSSPHRVPLPARLTNGALALGSASVAALFLLSLALPSRLCRWRVGRAVAAGAAAFWLLALAVFALVEVGAVGSGGEAVPSAREGRQHEAAG